MSPQGILFVSHDATRTGAPTELLHFLRWFKANGNRSFSILLGRGGELTPGFEELGETWSLDRSRWRPDRLRTILLDARGLGEWARRREANDAQRFAARCSPSLIYANSIASARVVDVLSPDVPILTHVHELGFVFRKLASPPLERLLTRTHCFIACSNAVKQNLIHEHEIAPERIETVHESIPVQQVRPRQTRGKVREELRVPNDALLVAACGTVTWTKGPDLFVQLARDLACRRQDVYFVWIGSGPMFELAQFEHDIRMTDLDNKIRLTGDVSNAADYLAAADVFVLTSRQDSYPLACLEAAALQKPIVCFARGGGAPELVEADCGYVVPYLDIRAMADRVLSLLDSADCRFKMGAAARRKVAERHDASLASPRIMDIMERTIAGG